MFQAVYDCALHHPGVAWLSALFVLVLAVERRPPLWGFLVVFAVEIALDAFFSGPFAPKVVQTIPAIGTALSVVFVILGDYRYFVLIEMADAPESSSPFGPLRAWLRAIPYALIVPALSTIARAVYPAPFVDERKTYLVYEVMFLVLALAIRFVILPRRNRAELTPTKPASTDSESTSPTSIEAPNGHGARAWATLLTDFEIVQYGLWALADVILLAGHSEPGYLLRLVPNVLYYGVFLLFVWRTSPARERSAEHRVDAHGSASAS